MLKARSCLLTILMFVFTCYPAYSVALDEEDNKTPNKIPKINSPVKIDGVLDETVWDNALKFQLNYEISPRDNVPPPVKTEVMLTYDKSNFYIAFRAFDPDPSQIRARLKDRDRETGDDWVAVELDTFNTERDVIVLLANPLGIQMDWIQLGAEVEMGWDIIWDTAGVITDWGYSVEFAVPFSSLRFQRIKSTQIWGFNAIRLYPRDVRHQIWNIPYDRNNNCRFCQYVKIEGFEGVSPGRNIEINPTLTALTTQARDNFPEGNFASRDKEIDAGINARWSIMPNMTLSGTVNPDFSQVEADSLQLDINQPFALFFQERRPFFTEGVDYFNSQLNVVYTRTMRDPNWGMKLTGKQGLNAIGAFVVRDNVTNLIFPGSQSSNSTSLSSENTSSVFRYRRDIWNNSRIGVIVTNREGGDYFNRVIGFDGNFRLSRKDRIDAQWLGSSTSYPDHIAESFGQPQDKFGDAAVTAAYTHGTRNFVFELNYANLGENFRADLGFIPQVGYRNYGTRAIYTWINSENSWWSNLRLLGYAVYTEDNEGHLLNKEFGSSFMYNGIYQTSFFVGTIHSSQHYNGLTFNLKQYDLRFNVDHSGALSLGFVATIGDRIDYANTRKGSRILLSPAANLNLGRHFQMNFAHNYEKMRVEGAHLYTANISQATLIYQFNPKAFIRSIIQYTNYDYNPANYTFAVDEEYKQLSSQLLFSYKINPRTVLFLGYADNYFGEQEFSLSQKDYTFFVKIGYAWVL
ncbi:MAG: carbohydrate binding family 9 domain-containing protein [Thermoplasmata archaeon]|nr:MAG: carbohydrate binding family 9 domain-containing protein [Thermoplasmata archaeon]